MTHQGDADHLSADEEHFREGFEVLGLGVRGPEHAQRNEQLTCADETGIRSLKLWPMSVADFWVQITP